MLTYESTGEYKKGRSIRIRIETGNIYGSDDELI